MSAKPLTLQITFTDSRQENLAAYFICFQFVEVAQERLDLAFSDKLEHRADRLVSRVSDVRRAVVDILEWKDSDVRSSTMTPLFGDVRRSLIICGRSWLKASQFFFSPTDRHFHSATIPTDWLYKKHRDRRGHMERTLGTIMSRCWPMIRTNVSIFGNNIFCRS